MKFSISLPRPRNPLVASARFRLAGSHRTNGTTQRQHAANSMRRELKEMKPIP